MLHLSIVYLALGISELKILKVKFYAYFPSFFTSARIVRSANDHLAVSHFAYRNLENGEIVELIPVLESK